MVAEESKDAYPELYKTLNEDSIASLKAASSDADGVIAQAQEYAANSKKDNRPFFGPYSDYSRGFKLLYGLFRLYGRSSRNVRQERIYI